MIPTKSTLEDIFKVLASGDPKEFKEAKRMIEKKWNAGDSEFKNAWVLVEQYMKEFDSIWNYFPHRSLDGRSPMEMR
jgi:predicted transcriptional regulator